MSNNPRPLPPPVPYVNRTPDTVKNLDYGCFPFRHDLSFLTSGKLVNFSGLDQTFADEAVAAMLLGNTATGGNVRPDGGSGGGGEVG